MTLSQTVLDVLADKASEDAYIAVCELVGPNSCEFEDLLEEYSHRYYYEAVEQAEEALGDD